MFTKTAEEKEKFPIDDEVKEVFRIFAFNLRILRVKSKLNYLELSEKLGMAKKRIADLECGSHKPTFAEVIKIVDFFPITFDTLLEKEIELAI